VRSAAPAAASSTAPKATVEEGEFCGDDSNGGCNNPSFAVSFIDLGDIVCGDYWADGSFRDTDWYEFTLAENRIVDVRVTGEILTNIFITTADCPASLLATGTGVGGVCEVAIEDKCLLAGTYRVVVVPATFNGFPCVDGAGKRYTLSLVDTGETCTGPENDSCPGAIVVADPEHDGVRLEPRLHRRRLAAGGVRLVRLGHDLQRPLVQVHRLVVEPLRDLDLRRG
jgi:hypothetical protein